MTHVLLSPSSRICLLVNEKLILIVTSESFCDLLDQSIVKIDPVKFTIYDPIAKIYSVKFSFLTCQLQKFVPWKFTANKMYAHKVIGSLVAGSGSQNIVYQWKVCTPGSLEGVLARPHNRCWWVHGIISEAWEITLKTIYCRLSSILSGCLDNLSAEPCPELINNSLLDEAYMFYKEYELFRESYLKRRKWKHCTNFGCIVWSWCVIKPWFRRICKKMIWTCSLVVGSFYLFTLQCRKINSQSLSFLFLRFLLRYNYYNYNYVLS